jgi:sugar phosphate isomerase/epimerase
MQPQNDTELATTRECDGWNHNSIGRRRFLQTLTVGSVALFSKLPLAYADPPRATNKICAFTKPLQSLSFDETAETFARIGYNGLEVGVRHNGYISPDQVDDQLPRLIEALHKHGLELTILTSDITSMEQPHAARVLRAASKAGIRTYRLGYYRYDLAKPIPEQLNAIRASLRDVIIASNDLGITPLYQNHSGADMVGAPLWDLHELLEKYSPEQIGVALDVGHIVVEGGLSWPVQYHLMRPHVRAIYVKDFVWKGHEVEWVPLGEGRVEPKVFNWLTDSGFDGPISIHVEYLEKTNSAHDTDAFVKAFERDLKTLRKFMPA